MATNDIIIRDAIKSFARSNGLKNRSASDQAWGANLATSRQVAHAVSVPFSRIARRATCTIAIPRTDYEIEWVLEDVDGS